MIVKLLEHTPNPDRVVARAAKQCYDSGFIGDNYEYPTDAKDTKLIEKVLSMGHTSILEHASFTFAIGGVSRSLSHQLVRFRTGISFSQQSQRYCFLGANFDRVTPPTIAASKLLYEYNLLMNQIGELYAEMVKEGIPAEDARFVLPNAACTNLVVSVNARELHHMFALRCCVHAQWEIRELANLMRAEVRKVTEAIFVNAGANCETKGICNEGKRSCNKLLTKQTE